jgi:hypothetical protein
MPIQNPQVKLVTVGDSGMELMVKEKVVDARGNRLASAKSIMALVLEKAKEDRGGMLILDSWIQSPRRSKL